MIEPALQLAQRGKLVFPCNADKTPLVKWSTVATSDIETVKSWWSHWPDAMIGLPCGEANNLFVVDMDVDKQTGDKLGQNSLQDLGYAGLLDNPHVRTPSGGIHLYFQHWDGGRNTVGQIGPGIDTRADGGYVIAGGSVGAAGAYEGAIDWDALPKLPLGLKARSAAPVRPRCSPSDFDRETTSDEVSELLSYIPADCDYGTWLNVLMALHAHYGGSDDGLAVAECWSAGGSKYKPGEVAAKWAGFKGNGITFATIPALARDNGADLSAIARKHGGQAHE